MDIRNYILEILENKRSAPDIKGFKNIKYIERSIDRGCILEYVKKDVVLYNLMNQEYIHRSEKELLEWGIEYNRYNSNSLLKLLEWGKDLLVCYAETINKYVLLKCQYEKLLFQEQFQEANRMIKLIEKKVSFSVWGLQQRILLSKMAVSDDDLNIEEDCGKMISLLVHYYKKMTDNSIDYLQYNDSIKDLLNTGDEKTPEWRYINYKLNILSNKTMQELKTALIIDEQMSIIDYYETFIDVLQQLYAKENLEAENKKIIQELNDYIDDTRIRNINIAYNGFRERNCLDENICTIIENYTCGNYCLVNNNIGHMMELYSNDFTICNLLLKAGANISAYKEYFKELWKEIEDIYRVNYTLAVSQKIIGKYYKLLYGTSWRYKILGILVRKLQYGFVTGTLERSILNDISLTPLFFQCIRSDSKKLEFLQCMSEKMPCTSELHKFVITGEKITNEIFGKIDKNRRFFYEIKYFIATKQYEECIKKAIPLLDGKCMDNQYNQERIRRSIFECYMRLERFADAMRLYVSSYIVAKELTIHMGLDVLIKKIEDSEDEMVKADIFRPLIMKFYYKNNDEYIISSYLDYLESQNVMTIVEYITQKDTFSLEEIIFLDKVCTQNLLMKDYVSLTKTKGNAAELRAIVLRRLLEEDEDNKKVYLLELNSIYKLMQLQNRINSFNHNRIFIDKENLYTYLHDVLKHEVAKFKAVQEIRKILGDSEFKLGEKSFLMESYWEITRFMYSVVDKITKAYLNDSPYSLENFLSTRIRHNYCKDNLKKEFEKQKLFFKKELDDSKDYTVNEYWKNILSVEEYSVVVEALSNFSRKIDTKIQEIRDEWIRIKKDENSVGMFNYLDSTDYFVNYIPFDFQNSLANTKELFNNVIIFLDQYTDSILKSIRERIQNELCDYYYEALLNLEGEIKKCDIEEKNRKEILRRIEISKAKYLDDIEGFKDIFFMENEIYPDFTFEELVEFCCKIEEEMNNEFSRAHIEVEVDVTEKYFGDIFPYMVDILGILIRNAVQHSEFVDMSKLELIIKIEPYLNGDFEKVLYESKYPQMPYNLVIRVVNNLANTVDESEISNKVEEKISNIENSMYREESIKEGGSGLYKIARTIDYSLGTCAAFYKNINEGKFDICLAIDLKKFIQGAI